MPRDHRRRQVCLVLMLELLLVMSHMHFALGECHCCFCCGAADAMHVETARTFVLDQCNSWDQASTAQRCYACVAQTPHRGDPTDGCHSPSLPYTPHVVQVQVHCVL
jgi:hypothetical protein